MCHFVPSLGKDQRGDIDRPCRESIVSPMGKNFVDTDVSTRITVHAQFKTSGLPELIN